MVFVAEIFDFNGFIIFTLQIIVRILFFGLIMLSIPNPLLL